MPGKTRGETRALHDTLLEYTHRHDLPLDHAAVASTPEKGEALSKIVPEHGASPDLLTALASDLSTPNNVSKSRSRPMQTYDDTPCINNSVVSYRQVLSGRRRRSN